MDITGKITGLVFLALLVFLLLKYVFPLLGAFLQFVSAMFHFLTKALPV